LDPFGSLLDAFEGIQLEESNQIGRVTQLLYVVGVSNYKGLTKAGEVGNAFFERFAIQGTFDVLEQIAGDLQLQNGVLS
jgi:hypothetical protein